MEKFEKKVLKYSQLKLRQYSSLEAYISGVFRV